MFNLTNSLFESWTCPHSIAASTGHASFRNGLSIAINLWSQSTSQHIGFPKMYWKNHLVFEKRKTVTHGSRPRSVRSTFLGKRRLWCSHESWRLFTSHDASQENTEARCWGVGSQKSQLEASCLFCSHTIKGFMAFFLVWYPSHVHLYFCKSQHCNNLSIGAEKSVDFFPAHPKI